MRRTALLSRAISAFSIDLWRTKSGNSFLATFSAFALFSRRIGEEGRQGRQLFLDHPSAIFSNGMTFCRLCDSLLRARGALPFRRASQCSDRVTGPGPAQRIRLTPRSQSTILTPFPARPLRVRLP